MDVLRKAAKDLIKAGALPSAQHLHRSSASLPSCILNQPAFGVGLELEEWSHPRWASRTIVISRVQPELGSISGNIYAKIRDLSSGKLAEAEEKVQPLDAYGGKWRIKRREFDPFKK